MRRSGVPVMCWMLLLVAALVEARAQVVIADGWNQQVVEEHMRILPIKSKTADFENTVLSGQLDSRFKPYDKDYFRGQKSANWLLLTITNQTKQRQELYLGTTRFELLTCWVKTDSGVAGPYRSGQTLPEAQKAVPTVGMSFFRVNCPPGQAVKVYLKAINYNAPLTPQVVRPFTLSKQATFQKAIEQSANFTLLFLGAAIIMFVYNFMLLIVTKVRAYLYYAAYIVCVSGYVLGLVPQFAYPFYGHMNQDEFPILQFASLGVAFYVLVGREAMEIKRHYPRLDKVLVYVIGSQLLAFVLSPIPELAVFRAFLNYPGISVGYGILLYVGVALALKKNQPGTLFMLASFIYLTGVFLYLSQLLGLAPATLLGLDIISLFQVAVSAEFALASLSLGARINEVRRQADVEKQAILAAQNEQLEKSVLERTAQINHQKRKIEVQRDSLERTLVELKSTQTQLVQQEKLASLGELTAGIAHEIQNPLNFVNNFADVSTELISEVEEEWAKGATRNEKLEADILRDLKKNLQRIVQHGSRASSIVRGMLEHARTAPGDKRPTNINDLCDEYLKIAYQGMRAKDRDQIVRFNCELVTDFDPANPIVNLVPQDMSRVLLNMFNNAFYALRQQKMEAMNDYQPRLSVSTRQDDHKVEVRIKDNGVGIPDQVKQKIFQPFFTTKPSGEGTGLGLSLSYDIIVKGHGGNLWVESQVGEGSEFVIQLPAMAVAEAPAQPAEIS